MKKNRVLFVGSNPSQASPDNTAFHQATRSYSVLSKWVEGLNIEAHYTNVSNEKSKDNRPIGNTADGGSIDEAIKHQNPEKIVALGKTASKALTKRGIAHLEMPHPSGRNRLLNDAEYVKAKVEELRKYVE